MMNISFRGNDHDLDIPSWVNDNYYKRKEQEARQMQAKKANAPRQTYVLASGGGKHAAKTGRKKTSLDGDTYVSRTKRTQARKQKNAQRLIAGILGLTAAVGFFVGGKDSKGGQTPPDVPETGIYEPYEVPEDDATELEGDTVYAPDDFLQSGAPENSPSFIVQELDPAFDFEYTLSDEQELSIDLFIDNWQKNKPRYEFIEEKTGVPAELVAAIHWREGSGDFDRCLTDGTPIGQPVTSPLCKDKIYYSFEESAIDVLNDDYLKSFKIEKSDYQTYLDYAEKYNGTGYRIYQGINSPYVWAGTDKYTSGKYVADGKYDPNYVDKQPGIAVLLRSILEA